MEKKLKEQMFADLQKVRVKSSTLLPHRPAGVYTNADVEAFNDAVDLTAQKYFSEGVGRQKRQEEVIEVLNGTQLTEEQKEKFVQVVKEKEEAYLRAQSVVWKTSDFSVVKTLGQGGFGIVRLVKYKPTGEVFAMKQMNKSAFPKKNDLQRLFSEKRCLATLSEGNKNNSFVKLFSCFQDDKHLYMIMEFLQGGDLISILMERHRLTEPETRFYIAELVQAVDYIHQSGYVHRDIKPDNICFGRDGHLKLLDFGLCKEIVDHGLLSEETLKSLDGKQILEDDNNNQITVEDYLKKSHDERRAHLNSWVGTPQYMAPEIVAREKYTKSVDFWAAGVVMYDCLVGSTPFSPSRGEDPMLQKLDPVRVVLYKIQKWKAYFAAALNKGKRYNLLKPAAEHLLCSLITESHRRFTIDQVRQHKFFDGLNFSDLPRMRAPIVPMVSSSVDTSKFPKLKDVPLPHWDTMSRKMDAIRYDAFDTTTSVEEPDIKKIASDVLKSLPTLLENGNRAGLKVATGSNKYYTGNHPADLKAPMVLGSKPKIGVSNLK